MGVPVTNLFVHEITMKIPHKPDYLRRGKAELSAIVEFDCPNDKYPSLAALLKALGEHLEQADR